VNQESWKKARALLWLGVTGLFVLTLLFITGALTIPGLPSSQVDLSGYRDWVFVILILLATKALLELLRPLFRSALRSHVRYEADIFAHFKLVSYVVWATALLLVAYILLGSGIGQSASAWLSVGLIGGALVYIMGEPLLSLVGWIVLVTLRLYKLGDRIEVNNTRGYVVGITPLNTTLREFGGILSGDIHTGRYVTIPNSQVLRGNVFNATKDTPFVWDQVTITVPYQSDAKAAEVLLLAAAEDVVGPMMRQNTNRIRNKYEFDDLREYVTEEPTVLWNLRDVGVDLTLIYFCPVFERIQYRTHLVKNILERSSQRPDIRLTAPAPVPSAAPLVPAVR
jgi:small-conductance mechanosensitive channel